MSSRGVFGLENIRGRQREGTWVPIPSVWTQSYLGDAGYFAGGEAPSADVSRIDKIAYSTDTKSTLTSNLYAPRRGMGGASSPTAGYTMGGFSPSVPNGPRSTKIDKLTYATQTTSLIPGNFSDTSTNNGAGGGSTTAGYLVQGSSPMVSYVRKITYATETIELLPGRVPNPRGVNDKSGSAGNGNTFLYIIGGSDGSGSEAKKLTYASDSVSNIPNMPTPGSLNRAVRPGCSSSSEAAFIVGGSNPYNNRIDKITFANDTCSYAGMNSTVPTPAGRFNVAGTGSPSAGYFAGGTSTSIVEKITYSSNSIARIPALDLTSGISAAAGFSPKADNHPNPDAKRFVDDSGPGGYGVEFDGSGDRLDFTLTSAPGAGDFTLEYWVKQNTLSDWQTHFATTRGSGFNVGTDGSGDFVFFGDGGRRIEVIGAITTGEWQHWAFARDGIAQTLTGYINGVEVASVADSNNYSPTTASIGNLVGENSEYTNGIISNLRFVVGTCLYKENFTPPTGPLEEVNNTVLLCCQSESDVTAVTVGNSMTASGDPQAVYSSTLPINQPPTVTPTPNKSPGPAFNGAIWMGGYNNAGGPTLSSGGKISFSDDSVTALPSTQLTGGRYNLAATSSSISGYYGQAATTQIVKVDYATNSPSTMPGGISGGNSGPAAPYDPRRRGTSFGPKTAGYFMNGDTGNSGNLSNLDKITYSTEVIARLPGSSSPNSAYAVSGTSNQTTGYKTGGTPGGSPLYKFPFSTESWGSVPSLGVTMWDAKTFANTTHGFWVGGDGNSDGSATYKLTFATDSSSRLPSSNSPHRVRYGWGSGNATHGYISGGNDNTPYRTSNIYKMSYSNDTWSGSLPNNLQPNSRQNAAAGARQNGNGDLAPNTIPNNF